ELDPVVSTTRAAARWPHPLPAARRPRLRADGGGGQAAHRDPPSPVARPGPSSCVPEVAPSRGLRHTRLITRRPRAGSMAGWTLVSGPAETAPELRREQDYLSTARRALALMREQTLS